MGKSDDDPAVEEAGELVVVIFARAVDVVVVEAADDEPLRFPG
jgi:hypothetical protein